MCKIEKSLSEFSKAQYRCKSCRRAVYKSTNGSSYKLYAKNNKEKISLKNKKYYQKNLTDIKLKKTLNKKYHTKYMRYYRENNKLKINECKRKYYKTKWKINPQFKLRMIMSSAIYIALHDQMSSKKQKSFLKYVDYSITELKEYLEKQFEPWMNWQNWGLYRKDIWDDKDESTWTWQLDHIIPQSKFIFSSMEDQEFKKCWALNNLRPYSAKQNIFEKNNR